VSFGPAGLRATLASLGVAGARRFIVGLSGGMDSVVLLDALVGACPELPVSALHINHQLHAESDRWAERCVALCDERHVPIEVLSVDVFGPGGPEAAARRARYAAFEARLADGDWLLLAHHRDDQAETLLLNLLRGAGLLGMAAMPARRPLGRGEVVRPLLNESRSALKAYASEHGLTWCEDPSNRDTSMDRNYLRHDVLPRLEARWPRAAAQLASAAEHAAQASALLDDLAAVDLQRAGGDPSALGIGTLIELPARRRRNLLRFALRALGLPLPGAARLASIDDAILAREDAEPLVSWSGVEVRRYRNVLYLLAPLPRVPGETELRQRNVELGALGSLRLVETDARGLDPRLLERGLSVRYRRGGERLRPTPEADSRALKKVLQDRGVPPWLRDRLPLIYSGERLVAVADWWLADDASSTPGLRIEWHTGPSGGPCVGAMGEAPSF